MCYYKGAKIKGEEVGLFAEDNKLNEDFDRDLQSGFAYHTYLVAHAKEGKR
jgi:hypothetical protein